VRKNDSAAPLVSSTRSADVVELQRDIPRRGGAKKVRKTKHLGEEEEKKKTAKKKEKAEVG
jgi:hypothetical protein